MDGERIARVADGVVKIRHGEILAVDAAEVVAGAGAAGREEVAGVAVEKKTEADDAEHDHQDGLRLAAKELHHNAATLLKTTERENMIVA